MTDVKRFAEEAGQRAALAAGRDAMRRVVEDLTLSSEDKAAREVARARARRLRTIKLGLGGVGLVAIVVGTLGALAQLWIYALALLATAAVGGLGYLFIRPKLVALKARATSRREARKRAEAEAHAQREVAAKERAAAAAAAEAHRKIDDELAALKRRAQSDRTG